MRLRSLLPILLLFAPAAIAAVDPAMFQDLQWRSIGPYRGGRVLAVSGVPGQPHHYYFGSVNGGVWETLDAGRTWKPIFDEQPVGSIGALAIAPSNPQVIHVGTGEADMRSDIAQGDGMFVSRDGGRTWKANGLEDSQQIGRILVHPRDPERVYVAVLGHPYGPNEQRGVYGTRDGGKTWRKLLGPDRDTGAIDLAFEPGSPDVIYASLWQTRRTPWNVYPPSSGPGSGVYKSTDGGESWERIQAGLPERFGRVGFAISAAAPKRVYALVDAEPGGGLYRSDDGGAHWRQTSGDTRIWQRGWYFGRIEADPRNPDRVYALNTIVLRTDDGGKTFLPLKGDITGDDFHDMWIDPQEPQRQVLGVDQGTIVTLNGGATWSSWHNQPTAQFYNVSTDNRFPYYVYGSQQDSGAAGVPSRNTHYDGINLTEFRELTAGGESDNIAPDPNDPETIYGGRVDKLDLRTRQTRHIAPTLAYPDHHRVVWTLPLVFSLRDPKVLYFAHQHIYRTDNGGERWTRISPDLTREDPGTPANLDPPTAALTEGRGPRRGVVYAIAPSPLRDHDLWAGTDDGLVWRTLDEGEHWTEVTPEGLQPWSKIGSIDPSAHDPETATIAVDRHRLDDFRPYVYRTRDGGKTWKLLVEGIAATHAVNVVREDPVRAGLLYAGTERGVYVSFDAGEQWQPLQRGLPRTSVRDIELKGRDVVIATHGRGFYILDDVSALRQLDPQAAPATRLFAPAPAWRVRPEGFSGTPFPKEEPASANPRSGAVIDYALAASATGPVSLTVRDAGGKLVRTYRSSDAPPKTDLTRLASAPEWVEPPVTLASKPGMHRFVWPLRYPAPTTLAEGNAYSEGVWAPPGKYALTLEVDGKRHEQVLEVVPDPRIDLPAEAYTRQFELARRIETERERVAAAAALAEKLQQEVGVRLREGDGKSAPLLEEFQEKLVTVSGKMPSTNPNNNWWMPARSLTSLRYLGSSLDALQIAVDGADAAPSPDALSGFDKILALMPEAFAAWNRLREQELAALNAALTRAGSKPLAFQP